MKNRIAILSILLTLALTACGGAGSRRRNNSSDDDWWNASFSTSKSSSSSNSSSSSFSIPSTSTTTSYSSEESSSSSYILEPGAYIIHTAMAYDECEVKEKINYNVIKDNVYSGDYSEGSWNTFSFETTTENVMCFRSSVRGTFTVDLDLPMPGEWWVQIGQYQVGETYGARILNSYPDSPYYDNRTGQRSYIINVPSEYNYYYCWGAYWTNAWPGNPLINHQAIFTTEYDGVVNIIFNYDGMIQTDDLSLPLEGGTYTWTGTTFIRN